MQAELEYPSEIISQISSEITRRQKIERKTVDHYKKLSSIQKQEITQWLKTHLAEIPMPDKIRKHGLAALLEQNYQHAAALTLLRSAMKELYAVEFIAQ